MKTLLHVSLFLERDGRVLLVQEADSEDEGRWNLPGGHVEPEETILAGAVREALEETGWDVSPTKLLGVYARTGTAEKRVVRFVIRAECGIGEPIAGEGVLAVRWVAAAELVALPDNDLLNGAVLRRILSDGFDGVGYPLAALQETS